MNAFEICILVGLVAGLIQFIHTKPSFLKILVLSLCFCLIVGYFTSLPFKSYVFVIFGGTILIFISYTALRREWLAMFIATGALLSVLWILFQFPYYNILRILMILPLLGLIRALFLWRKYKHLMAILCVLAAYQLSELIRYSGW